MDQAQKMQNQKIEKYPPKPSNTPQFRKEINQYFLAKQNKNEEVKQQPTSRKSRNIQGYSQEKLAQAQPNEGNQPLNKSGQFLQKSLEKSQLNEDEFKQKYNIIFTKQQQILLQNPDYKENFWQFHRIIQNMDKEIGVLKKENETQKTENQKQVNYQQQINNLNQKQIQLDQQNNQLKTQIKQQEAEVFKEKNKVQKLEDDLKNLEKIEHENNQLKQEIISLKDNITSQQVKLDNLDNQFKNQSKIFYESQEEFQNLLIQKLKETFPKLDINHISIKSDKTLQEQLKSIVIQNEKTIDSNIEQIEKKMVQYMIEIRVEESKKEEYLENLNEINPAFENVLNATESVKKAIENLIKKNEKIVWNSNNKEQQKVTYLQQHLVAFNSFSLIVKKVHTYLQFIINQAQRFAQSKYIFQSFLIGQSLKQNQDQFESTAEKQKPEIITNEINQLSQFKSQSSQQQSTVKNSQNFQQEQTSKVTQEVQTNIITLQNKDKAIQTQGTAQVCGRCKYQSLLTQEITMVVKCHCWLFGNRLNKAKEINI